jgi:hypothetical protein
MNLEFLKRAIEELSTVADELDLEDAEYDRGLLKTAFSALISAGFVTTGQNEKDLGLRDLIELLFGENAAETLKDRAQSFDNLLDTYVGEPTAEDIEEAQIHLRRVIEALKKRLQRKTR